MNLTKSIIFSILIGSLIGTSAAFIETVYDYKRKIKLQKQFILGGSSYKCAETNKLVEDK